MMKRILSTNRPKLFIIVIAVVLACLFAIVFSHVTVKSKTLNNEQKLYKSIMVESGDTLWDIAKENCGENEALEDYVEELKSINGIPDGNVKSGCYIIVSYTESIENINK